MKNTTLNEGSSIQWLTKRQHTTCFTPSLHKPQPQPMLLQRCPSNAHSEQNCVYQSVWEDFLQPHFFLQAGHDLLSRYNSWQCHWILAFRSYFLPPFFFCSERTWNPIQFLVRCQKPQVFELLFWWGRGRPQQSAQNWHATTTLREDGGVGAGQKLMKIPGILLREPAQVSCSLVPASPSPTPPASSISDWCILLMKERVLRGYLQTLFLKNNYFRLKAALVKTIFWQISFINFNGHELSW